MNYADILATCEESKHFISMVPLERVVRLGFDMGMNKDTTVLDFCCGYGEMLKIWSEAFDISGVGIDRVPAFIEEGKKRVDSAKITLLTGDIFAYRDDKKYDVVVCTELSQGVFLSWQEGVAFLERFGKPGGKLVFGSLYAKAPNPPKALIDFDGELFTLSEINQHVRDAGYYITAMASETHAEWERYVLWSVRRNLAQLKETPTDKKLAAWIDKESSMYFEYRRAWEGWALFSIEKLEGDHNDNK
jgi:SAM-dependent methyltransferase